MIGNNVRNGVKWYTEGIARFAVYFPEGECNCRNCPHCYFREGFGNYRCALLEGVYIQKHELDDRHPICPIEFMQTEF